MGIKREKETEKERHKEKQRIEQKKYLKNIGWAFSRIDERYQALEWSKGATSGKNKKTQGHK